MSENGKTPRTKLAHDQFSIFVRQYTVVLYWPNVNLSRKCKAVFLPTVLAWRPARDWAWRWAAAIRVLGFGIGVSFNHCENPNYESPDESQATT